MRTGQCPQDCGEFLLGLAQAAARKSLPRLPPKPSGNTVKAQSPTPPDLSAATPSQSTAANNMVILFANTPQSDITQLSGRVSSRLSCEPATVPSNNGRSFALAQAGGDEALLAPRKRQRRASTRSGSYAADGDSDLTATAATGPRIAALAQPQPVLRAAAMQLRAASFWGADYAPPQ